MYPGLALDNSLRSHGDVASALVSQRCSAAIVPRIDYDTWLTEPRNCKLAAVGASLYFASGGWVTNLNATLCVSRAIESALHALSASGELTQLLAKWAPKAPCDV